MPLPTAQQCSSVTRTCAASMILFFSFSANGEDWPLWRGPSGNGIADSNAQPPTLWSDSQNVVWKSAIPGRGHSSPIVNANQIFITTADVEKQTQSVICYLADSGKKAWSTVVHSGNLSTTIHKKNTHASPTIACDGKNIFAYFLNSDAVFLTKIDFNGKILWQKNLGNYQSTFPFGFAPSPTIFNSMIIVAAESKTGFLAALDPNTGKTIWRIDRKKSSYSTPVVANIDGQPQILLSGNKAVTAFHPSDGHLLWKSPARWQVSCGTLVWSDRLVFASGGFPTAQTLCVRGDGSAEVLWQNNVKCYEQSMLYYQGYLYGISDQGIGYCWKADTGQQQWKSRLEGPVSSSPILANGNIYYTSERGTTFVFRANPSQFELIAKNKLGISTFATPAFVNNRIISRVAFDNAKTRQEYLFCLGN